MKAKIKNKIKKSIKDKIQNHEDYLVALNNFNNNGNFIDKLSTKFVEYSIDPLWERHKDILNDIKLLGIKDVAEQVAVKDDISKYSNGLMNVAREYMDVSAISTEMVIYAYESIRRAESGKKINNFIVVYDILNDNKAVRDKLKLLMKKIRETYL